MNRLQDLLDYLVVHTLHKDAGASSFDLVATVKAGKYAQYRALVGVRGMESQDHEVILEDAVAFIRRTSYDLPERDITMTVRMGRMAEPTMCDLIATFAYRV